MSDLERERDFYKALAEAYRKFGLRWYAKTWTDPHMPEEVASIEAANELDIVRRHVQMRFEAEHAAPKPADNFASCYSPPGWVDPDQED